MQMPRATSVVIPTAGALRPSGGTSERKSFYLVKEIRHIQHRSKILRSAQDDTRGRAPGGRHRGKDHRRGFCRMSCIPKRILQEYLQFSFNKAPF